MKTTAMVTVTDRDGQTVWAEQWEIDDIPALITALLDPLDRTAVFKDGGQWSPFNTISITDFEQ